MPPGSSLSDTLRTDGAPPPALLAVAVVLATALLAGTSVFWPVETTDYKFQTEVTPVASAPDDEVIAYEDLPPGARTAFDREIANPDSGLDHYRTTASEIRRLEQHSYVAYQGQYYPYELRHRHDRAMAFGRGALLGLGAIVLVLSGLTWATDRSRPLTAATGALLPIGVAIALVGAYGIDLVFGGPGNTLPTRDGGATYFLALTVVLFLGTLGARARVGVHWFLGGIFALGVAFVMWEASTYILEEGAPAFPWLVIAVVAALGLVAVLLPVVGLGYLLSAPADPAE